MHRKGSSFVNVPSYRWIKTRKRRRTRNGRMRRRKVPSLKRRCWRRGSLSPAWDTDLIQGKILFFVFFTLSLVYFTVIITISVILTSPWPTACFWSLAGSDCVYVCTVMTPCMSFMLCLSLGTEWKTPGWALTSSYTPQATDVSDIHVWRDRTAEKSSLSQQKGNKEHGC